MLFRLGTFVCIWLWLGWHSPSLFASEMTQVTFHINAPNNTPDEARVFISGDFESWSGGATNDPRYQAEKLSPGNYRLTLTLPSDKTIEYKFTLGDWSSVERDVSGGQISNRSLLIEGTDQQIDIDIEGWRLIDSIDELKVAIEDVMQQHQVAALAVVLTEPDGKQWLETFGLRHKALQLPADEDTLFRVGSITKMFAALAVLQLQEKGLLDLNDTLVNLAPEVAFHNPWHDTHPVRLVHLLEHTTGWDDMHFSEYSHNDPDPIAIGDALAFRPESRTSRWPPGTRYSYSNIGAAVVAFIVEKVTGVEFEHYVKDNIFSPLQMNGATYRYNDDYRNNGVTPYYQDKPIDYEHILFRPAGSVNASAKDMQNYLTMLIERGRYENGEIVSPASLSRMETPVSSLAAKAGVKTGYALANYQEAIKGAVFYGHGGAINGALSELQYSPELNAGYVIMISTANRAIGEIKNLLQGYLTRHHGAPPLSEANTQVLPEFKLLEGYYLLNNPRGESFRFITDIASFSVLEVEGEDIHFNNLFNPNRKRIFRPHAEGLAKYAQNDRIGFVVVQDPVLGQMLDMGGQAYHRISGVRVWTTLGLMGLFVVTAFTTLFYGLYWLVRVATKNPYSASQIWSKAYGLIALVVLGLTIVSVANGEFLSMGVISFTTLSLFIGSLVYGVVSSWGTLVNGFALYRDGHSLVNWHNFLSVALHFILALYLLSHGMIGVTTWL